MAYEKHFDFFGVWNSNILIFNLTNINNFFCQNGMFCSCECDMTIFKQKRDCITHTRIKCNKREICVSQTNK